MQNASSAGRKLTNEERVEVVKRQKKRNSFQLAMLSVIGILGFLLLWQAAVLAGVLPSRYVPAYGGYRTVCYKAGGSQSGRRGAGVHIMASLQVALTGFLLAIVIGIPLGLLWAGSGDSTNLCGPSLKFCGPYRRFPGFR